SETIGPFVGKIQEITKPLQPIIDIVTARIPVLSDLAGRKITLADIAGAFGDFDPGMIYAIADIISLVNSLHLDSGGPGSLFLPLGDFKIIDTAHPDQAFLGNHGNMLTDPNLDFTSMSQADFDSKLGSINAAGGNLTTGDLTDIGSGLLDSLLG